jgi:hypothetical protein
MPSPRLPVVSEVASDMLASLGLRLMNRAKGLGFRALSCHPGTSQVGALPRLSSEAARLCCCLELAHWGSLPLLPPDRRGRHPAHLPPPTTSRLLQVACLDDVRSVIKLEGAPLVEYLQVRQRILLLAVVLPTACFALLYDAPCSKLCSPRCATL